jgi:putative membrane protein
MSYLDDPRVLFAAERTLLAWVRTAVTLMALGFVVERFGLFLALIEDDSRAGGRGASTWIGVSLVVLAAAVLALAIYQHLCLLRTLGPNEVPAGYRTWLATSLAMALVLLGSLLAAYLVTH